MTASGLVLHTRGSAWCRTSCWPVKCSEMLPASVLFSLQAANSYLRDQWFHSLQWKVSPGSVLIRGATLSPGGWRAGVFSPPGLFALLSESPYLTL